MGELYKKLCRSLDRNKLTRQTEIILKYESNINAIDHRGNTLLHYIAEKNNLALINIIIKRKNLNLNIVSRPGINFNIDSMHEMMFECGTPLLRSIQSKTTEISKILINAGANLNISNNLGITPLLASIANDDTELATILINSGADTNLSDLCENTPLLETVKSNNIELTKILINAGANIDASDAYKTTPLLTSIRNHQIEMTKLLINSGADINLKGMYDETPLVTSIRNNIEEISEFLINFGANVHLRDFAELTPLHMAIMKMNFRTAANLLEHNANINARNADGQTPLMVLCISDNYSYSSDTMLDLLLSYGADVNIFDNTRRSPINQVALISEVGVNKLLNHKPRFDALDINGYSSIFIFFKEFVDEGSIIRALEQGCCVKQTDPCGASVLHYAIDANYKRVALKLLSNGFDVNCRDHQGNTPLHKACFEDIEIMCILLYYGANPNLLSNDNTSPLINAIASEYQDCVDLLFFSYDGLNGDDCHKVVYSILKNPSANRIDVPRIMAMLTKFEHFMENNKVQFQKYSFSCKNQNSLAIIIKYFTDLNARIKSFHLMEYIFFDCENYYYELISSSLSNPSLRKEKLSLVWSSLSLGITCDDWDFYKCTSISELLFDKELFALIWASDFHQFLSNRYHSMEINKLFEIYSKLLYVDIESIRGKFLIDKLLLFETDWQDMDSDSEFGSEFDDDSDNGSEYDSDGEDEYESDGESEYITKLFSFLSFFSTENYRKSTGMSDYTTSGAKKHYYELPNSVKTLAEISRDKARVFIKTKFEAKNFYEIHEVINNLDIPVKVKRFLQLRIPVNCKECRVMWCTCDVNEVAKALCLDDVN